MVVDVVVVDVVVVDDDVERNGSERCVDVDVDPILLLFAEVGREEEDNFSYLAFMDCHV